MARKQTARELYDERSETIARVMDRIKIELAKHKTEAEATPGHWGYPGDLGHVLEKLIQTLAFLSNREPEEIEQLLDDCR